MAQSFIQQMYDAFGKRNVVLARSPSTGLYSEVGQAVLLTATLVSDAQGVIVLNYAAAQLTQIYDVQVVPIAPSKAPADHVSARLVGVPTVTGLTIQTYKPALAALGAVALQVAASVPVYVVIRAKQ